MPVASLASIEVLSRGWAATDMAIDLTKFKWNPYGIILQHTITIILVVAIYLTRSHRVIALILLILAAFWIYDGYFKFFFRHAYYHLVLRPKELRCSAPL